MRVHIYRNRADDDRTKSQLHFCHACGGWYGVPHDGGHCQQGEAAKFDATKCACRFCRERSGKPVEGSYGKFSEALAWQPPSDTYGIPHPSPDERQVSGDTPTDITDQFGEQAVTPGRYAHPIIETTP